jgi:hypothetical protein
VASAGLHAGNGSDAARRLITAKKRRSTTASSSVIAKGARVITRIAHGQETRLVGLKVIDFGEHSREFKMMVVQPTLPKVE